jgi:flotillin
MPTWLIPVVIIVVAVLLIPVIISQFLTTVEAGTIRMVTSMGGGTKIYRGPGKATEIPIFTTGTTIPSKAINIDLDISDQTADMGSDGIPRPIKVRVLASAIVSVGDSNEMIMTAANKFFAKNLEEQNGILSDLLTSTGRRAINLLNHDELFSAGGTGTAGPEEDDRLAIIIKGACSRELQDLGLVFNSLNIKEVQSEVAEARRRQSAVEAKANADIVAADQERRAKEAQLQAEQAVNDKQRDLERRKAENAAGISQAEAERQNALAIQREAELRATLIAQANADLAKARVDAEGEAMRKRVAAEADASKMKIGAEADAAKMKIEAEANANRVTITAGAESTRTKIAADAEAERTLKIAQAEAEAEAVKIRAVGLAQADAIRAVNEAIREGGSAYLNLKQLEMTPQITAEIAKALAQAKMVNISGGAGGGNAAGDTASQLTGIVQSLLATRLIGEQLQSDQKQNATPSES